MLEEKNLEQEEQDFDDAFLSGLLDDNDDYVNIPAGGPEESGDADESGTAQLDGAGEGAEEPAASEAETTPAGAGDTNPGAEEEVFELTYNGEKISLPKSEVTALAQKGMNYDHVKGQLDGLKSSETHRLLAQLAADAGMSEGEYLRKIAGSVSNRRAEELAMSEGISPELAKRLMNAEDKVKGYEEEAARRNDTERRNRMFREFVRTHPDVKPEDIPPEVYREVQAGADLTAAYEKYEISNLKTKNKELEDTIAQFRQNESNRQKAVGSVRGAKTATTEDAFLSGLLGN